MGRAGAGESGGKLLSGVRVALLHPEWDRPCGVCETYLFRDDGAVTRRAGLPVLRPAGTPTPCGKCAKVPAAARQQGLPWQDLRKLAEDLTPQNRAAWQFYRECRAVGSFPDDPLVRWAAVLIRDVEAVAERQPLERLTAAVAGLVASFPSRR
ncbi:MAG: hypothetical protein JWO38_6857 [Gemmataceae bacterium]|nr:hypothetical protein [Gemmataceae bacterium]